MEYEYNEYYGLATTPNDDYLAHYGVKGMKWGVRKAIASGNSARLGRQYRKAARKLAKLEKRAASGSKYAKRAAALAAGTALAGGVAATGTRGINAAMNAAGSGLNAGGALLGRAAKHVSNQKIRSAMQSAAAGVGYAGRRVQRGGSAVGDWGAKTHDVATAARNVGGTYGGQIGAQAGDKVAKTLEKYGKGSISNSGLVRLGAAGVGAGLGAGAAYNAYRAATTKRAARKAAEFRKEMNKAFAGTQYANGGGGSRKRRRSRG